VVGLLLAKPQTSSKEVNRAAIYIVNPVQGYHYVPALCSSFRKLLETYNREVGYTERQTTFAFRILPISYFSPRETIPILSAREFKFLAQDVYDRCTQNLGVSSSVSTCLFQLAAKLPKSLDFKLTAEPHTIAFENPELHVAYTWSAESRWMSCASSNSHGNSSWSASYWLGFNSIEMSFRRVAKEIFETIKESRTSDAGNLTIYMVRDSTMTAMEVNGTLLDHVNSRKLC
jgi:hypothetical protein